MAMDDKGGMSGYSKPKNKPNSKKKVKAREEARKASGMSAQKFYVTTRLAEAAKSGKKRDRAALRKKFQSGDVARKGFAAPKKKMGGSSSSSTGSSSSSKTSSSYTPGMGGSRTTIVTNKNPYGGSAAPKKLYGPHVSETTKPSAEPLYKQFGGTSKDKSKYNYKGPGAKDPANKTSTLKAKADAKTAKNKAYVYKGPGAKDPANKTSTLKAKADQKAKEKNQPQRGPGRSRGK